jgi:hypothetical protein
MDFLSRLWHGAWNLILQGPDEDIEERAEKDL